MKYSSLAGSEEGDAGSDASNSSVGLIRYEHKGRHLQMTTLYVFSGTGNSLAVAQSLAEQIDGNVLSIPRLRTRDRVTSEADVVGLVFPVYHKSFPLIVKRFAEKLRVSDGAYVFAVYTYGDTAGLAVDHLRDLLRERNVELAAGFGVRMPYNYITPSPVVRSFFRSFTLREIPEETREALVEGAVSRVETIATAVRSREADTYERTADVITPLTERLGMPEILGKWAWMKIAGIEDPPDLPFIEARQVMDRAFRFDGACNGCGVCSRICPVENIEMVDDRPRWQGRCEQCFACLQWCPQEAIQFREATAGQARYHHPDVTLADMLGLSPG